MPPPRAPIASLEETHEVAVALLARKSRSVSEVREHLRDRGADEGWIDEVLARLVSHRHVDDAVLAEDQAFALIEGKGLAPEAAVQMLCERGIAGALAREAVEAARDGRSETALCLRALRARIGEGPLSASQVAREARALGRLGYEAEVIGAVLERVTAAESGA